MELYETLLIIAGSILFLFALALVVVLVKKEKPFAKAIWLILISFFMMGFSAISNAEIFGLFKYEKEKKLNEIEALSDASQICPDNTAIKAMLTSKIIDFEGREELNNAEENAILGYGYYSVGNQNKAIKYSEKALLIDDSNKKAKGTIELAKTRNLMQDLPKTDNKEQFQLELNDKLKILEESPNINTNQINRLKADIKSNPNLLKAESGKINL